MTDPDGIRSLTILMALSSANRISWLEDRSAAACFPLEELGTIAFEGEERTREVGTLGDGGISATVLGSWILFEDEGASGSSSASIDAMGSLDPGTLCSDLVSDTKY